MSWPSLEFVSLSCAFPDSFLVPPLLSSNWTSAVLWPHPYALLIASLLTPPKAMALLFRHHDPCDDHLSNVGFNNTNPQIWPSSRGTPKQNKHLCGSLCKDTIYTVENNSINMSKILFGKYLVSIKLHYFFLSIIWLFIYFIYLF